MKLGSTRKSMPRKFKKGRTKLKLIGYDGNAFVILARAQSAAKKAGWTDAEIKEYMDKAQSGSYDHLLEVTSEYFYTY
jgi:hypothetical protein